MKSRLYAFIPVLAFLARFNHCASAEDVSFPGAEPWDKSFFLTMNYVDDKYLYHVYEQSGYWFNGDAYNNGYIKVYMHNFNLAGTIPSESLMTDSSPYWTEITKIVSNDKYLYVGTSGGDVIQIDKSTLQRTGWCNLGDYHITGIVDRGDGYLYVTTYFGPKGYCKPGNNQFHKIDPEGMSVVGGFWAPDSTHSLVSDGKYLYSTTCCYSYDPALTWGDFEGPVEGGLVLVLDPVTMNGHDVLSANMEELGNDFLIVGNQAYFMDITDILYTLDLSTKKIQPITEIDDLYVRRFFFTGNRIYAENTAGPGQGAYGYYRMEISNPATVVTLDSDKEVFSIFVFKRHMYISYGHELVIKDINRKPVFEPIGPFTVHEKEQLKFKVSASDPDGDELAYEVAGGTLPDGASFDPEDGLFSWTPSEGQSCEQPYSVEFVAKDPWAGEAKAYAQIAVKWASKFKPVPKGPVKESWKNGREEAGFQKRDVGKAIILTQPSVEVPENPFPPIPGGPDPVPWKRQSGKAGTYYTR